MYRLRGGKTMLKFTVITIFFVNYLAIGSGQPKLKGSNSQFSNILGIVNQNKYLTNKRQNVDVRLQNLHRYNKEKKQHVKQWIKNALSDNNFSTQPFKNEGLFQIIWVRV